jgi:peroxin-19
MMNMFQGLMGNLGKGDNKDPSSSEEAQPQMDEIFKQFTSFLKDQEGEGDETFKGALDSVVKEIISKDSLYLPMKNLKEEYPKWLEENWQNLNDEDLEKYNKQLDKVTDICELFENAEDTSQPKDEVFELLSQL